MRNVTYEPLAFTELSGWAEDDHLAALTAFRASCPRLARRRAVVAADPVEAEASAALLAVCDLALKLPPKLPKAEARAFFERHFLPYRTVHAGTEGLLTGYYEPILEGSRTPTDRFPTPLMRRPSDLVTVVPETRAAAPATMTHARRSGAGLVPFPTRAEIDAGALRGQGLELLYVTDAVEKFFLQIQGSGRVRLTDGSFIRVQYDGKNGHPYTSIGRYLIDQGLLAADKMSMGALGRWLKADPERGRRVMNQNASYVFFKEMPASAAGPLGALEVELVAGRSLAVDPAFHRLGTPVYVDASTLQPPRHTRPFRRLMVAHDVGSAIRGPERGDIYFGSGDEAARVAGGTRHPGNLYSLRPVASAVANVAVTRGPAATTSATGAIEKRK